MKYIGINGVLKEASAAVVHVSDHGFLYGIGLFETFRTYGGVPFLPDRHLQRLAKGCKMLGIPFELDAEQWIRYIQCLMEANGLEDAYIRYTVSAGEEDLGLPAGDYRSPNHVLFAKPLPDLPRNAAQRAKGLQLLQTPRSRPESSIRLKSLHYMNNVIAKRELMSYTNAVKHKAEGLMLTEDGYLAEGIVSNLFFVRNGILHTPDLSTGILAGITREFILELAGERHVSCREALYRWEDLKQAEEVFMTNSIQEIVPVNTLFDSEGNMYAVNGGQTGPLTVALLQDYWEKVGMK